METFPNTTVPASLHDVDFMVKDSKRFADSGGWGLAAFKYDAATDTFTPFTLADQPPQGNDAKCGLACRTIVKTRDYVFTDYGSIKRTSWKSCGPCSWRRHLPHRDRATLSIGAPAYDIRCDISDKTRKGRDTCG